MKRWMQGWFRRRPHDPERNAAEYVTGELSRRARRWFEAHMLHCEDCWREVLLGRLGRRIAEEAREQAPADLRDRVRAAVQFTGDAGPPGPPSGT
ncbi:MAG: zf-HC2 domain-containing protein [Actinobacteria bacterium]|nr:zf-HC2 domain-containing protein [Actinomycetota bacterium]